LTAEERNQLTKRPTDNIEAYHAHLKGRYFWNKRTTESLNKGIEYFKQAIDIDPAYALAYAGLSDSYTLLVVREAILPEEGFAKAKAAAAMALRIYEQFAEAHASLGHAMLHNWEWEDAEKELKRAIELSPGYPSAHHWYSEHLTAMGRCDESIAELKLAEKLDPLSLVISADLGRAFYYARDYDQVMRQEARTLEMDSSFWLSHINLGRSYTQKKMHAEAINKLQKARELSVGNTEVLSFLGFAYAAAGRRDEALETLRELDEHAKRTRVPPYHLAIIHAGLGEKDQAFGWLERAFEMHAVDLFTLKVEPMFDCLRSDQRFEDLLRRMGLAPLEFVTKPESITIEAANQAKPVAIAVLPFRPITAEGRDEYLELGIADALITKLSDLNQVVVRPTSSVRKYTDLEQDSVTAGRELGVEAVLEGSMQKLADRIRITARLVRVEDGRSLWTGKFDEKFTDIFSVEDSISEKVAAALALKLTGQEKERLAKRYTENTAAYHLYLKGRYYWNKRSEDALRKSIDCFYQAIEIDPNYALAYAGLADAYTFLGDVGITAIPPSEAFSKGKAAAAKALKIDDALAEAHASLGHLNMHNFRWADARNELNRAIELKPNYASTHQWYAFFLIFTGSVDEALAEINHALWLDPLSQPINTDVAEMLYYAGRYDQAIEQFRKTLEMYPQYSRAHLNLGRVYERLQMRDEAIAEFQTAQTLSDSPEVLAALAHAQAIWGNRAEAINLLEELSTLAKRKHVSPYDMAVIHAGLGDSDRAFEWLDKGYDEGAGWMIYITVDPRLESLRTDARYASLRARIGL
jgi:tetratricopeptide (TPR) repeat protein